MKRKPSTIEKYVVAAVLLAIAFGLRYGLYGTLDNRLPFTFFLTATIIAAWYGGLGPGMLAAIGGLVLGDYFFLPSRDAGAPVTEAVRTGIGLYAMNVTLIVVLFWHLHSRLRDAEYELQKKNGGQSQKEPSHPEPHPGPPGEVRPL